MNTSIPKTALQLRSLIRRSGELEISLAGALQMQAIAIYGKRATGAKYLINPRKGGAA